MTRNLKFIVALLLTCIVNRVLCCYDDDQCDNFQKCCEGGYCGSDCDDSGSDYDDSGLTTSTIVVIIIFAVIFKVGFWITVWYCCRRRRYGGVVFRQFQNAPTTVVVNNSNQTHSYPPQCAPTQQHPGFVFPQNNPPMQNMANIPPPEYRENGQSWRTFIYCTQSLRDHVFIKDVKLKHWTAFNLALGV